MKILFQNSDLVIVFKEPNTLSVPSRDPKDPRTCLGLELQKYLGQQVWPTHRLDFEVAGLLLFALNAKAHKIINLAFEHQKIQKTYLALSSPSSRSPTEGARVEWSGKMLRGKKRSFFADHGKESLTQAQLLEKTEQYLLWQLKPITGRSHQLRLHLSHNVAPIMGDLLYGSPKPLKNGIALHSIEISAKGNPELLELGLPECFQYKAEFDILVAKIKNELISENH